MKFDTFRLSTAQKTCKPLRKPANGSIMGADNQYLSNFTDSDQTNIVNKLRILFFLVLLPLMVSGMEFDELRTHHYSEANGLSGNQVYSFAQDQNGMMWIGTNSGLNRFDGNNFKVFKKDFANENSIRDNVAFKIAIDRDNNVWVGYGSGGISCYNQTTRKFTHYLPDSSKKNTIEYGTVDGMCIDSKNRIWLGIARKGLMCFDIATGKFTSLGLLPFGSKKRSLSAQQYYNRITQLEIDSLGILWMATGDGFYSYNTNTEEWKVYRFDSKEEDINAFKRDVFSNLFRTGPDDFYLCGWGRGLNHYNLKTGKWSTFLPNPKKPENGTANIVSAIHRKSKYELWITSADTGLLVFNMITNKFTPLPVSVVMKNNLPPSNLGLIYADRKGDLWFAHNNGFHIFEQGEPEFRFTKLPVTFSGNGDFYGVTSSLRDPITGKLFLATTYCDGLNVIDTTGKQEHFTFETSEDSIYLMGELFLDSRNNIWVCSYEHLYHFDREKNALRKIKQPVPDTSFKTEPVFAEFAEAPDGKIWIATYRHGIYIYDYKTDSYSQLYHHQNNKNSLLSNIITGLAVDPSGKIWIGYKAEGVSKYDPETGKFTHYVNELGNPKSLIDNRIFCIRCDRQGQVWIATATGLVKIDRECKPGEVRNFIKDQQLLGALVSDLAFDKFGKLWFASIKGLSVYDPKTGLLKNYNVTNGLYSIFESLSIHHHYNGEFFIGSFSGYYKFDPSIADRLEKPGKVLITNFMVGEREIPYEAELADHKRIELASADNFFAIEFNTINFLNPVGIVYYYRLSDEEWKQIPRKGYASYSHLPGGDYVFEVKVMNAFGTFSDVTRLPIHIKTPFYKTPLFSIIMILLVSGAIFLLYRYRIREIEKTEAIKTHFNKQLAETEMRALRAQMNPHFIFNCLNSINRYIIKNDQKTASLYLTKFAKLIRLILDNSEQHVVALSQDLEALKLYIEIEALRFDYKFSFEIDVDQDVFTDTILVPSMLIQPFVENAIWHGLLHKEVPGRLSIRVKRDADMLVVEVEDDGVGRQKAQEMKSKSATTRKSLGLKITADRLSMLHNHNGQQGSIEYIDLADGNGQPCGTLVKIKIPVDDDK